MTKLFKSPEWGGMLQRAEENEEFDEIDDIDLLECEEIVGEKL
jgi:hypothetical protein